MQRQTGRRPEILIIDDSPEQIHLVNAILQEENYLVRALTNGRKLEDSLKNGLPDLILLDIVMPEINGLEICQSLKAHPEYAVIPVIFLTAMNDGDSIIKGFLAGAQDYVAKPVNPRELLARVNTHINLKMKTDKLEEAYKDIEAFNHMVSHDLKAPLWAIQRMAQHLTKVDAQERDEVVSIMCEKANEAVMLINKFSQISKTLNTRFVEERIDMQQLTEEVYQSLIDDVKNRKVEFSLASLPVVYGDRMLLRQVLVNVLSNALKFTRDRAETVIAIACKRTSTEYVFSVKDNGTGFAMKYADRLFGMFQRLHSEQEFEGSGTGLVIVKKIIERHGGRVWITGEPDHGAELSFTLPAASLIE